MSVEPRDWSLEKKLLVNALLAEMMKPIHNYLIFMDSRWESPNESGLKASLKQVNRQQVFTLVHSFMSQLAHSASKPYPSLAPSTIRSNHLIKYTDQIMNAWYEKNRSNPHPTDEVKKQLSKETRISEENVVEWLRARVQFEEQESKIVGKKSGSAPKRRNGRNRPRKAPYSA
jgi:hypothetical protein